jgi:Kef-type K+ transport system membrane component KefB
MTTIAVFAAAETAGTIRRPISILLTIAVVVAVARGVGSVMRRCGQPRVMGEIVAGILLGPSVLGVVWPEGLALLFPSESTTALRPLAQLGVIFFMFMVGAEVDFDLLRGSGKRAVAVSLSSVIAPMSLGVALGIWLHPRLGGSTDRFGFALFLGAAMSVTAFPVLARLLRETGLANTRLGALAIACASVDDVIAWCLLAGVVAIVDATGWNELLSVLGAMVTFGVLVRWFVRPLLARLKSTPLWLACCLALLLAWITDKAGIHAIFGAFVAGLILPRSGDAIERLRAEVEPLTAVVLLPVFFVSVGLTARIDLLDSRYLWQVAALVIAIAVSGKLGGAAAAAKLCGEDWKTSIRIGVLMNTRGLTELVILSVGLERGLISAQVFTIMVLMALATTFMAAPLLALINRWKPIRRRPLTEDKSVDHATLGGRPLPVRTPF